MSQFIKNGPLSQSKDVQRGTFFFFLNQRTHSAPSELRPVSSAECTQVRERTDKARCQNSTCSPRSYFCGSALKYSICLQLNPRCATTSSAECLLRHSPTRGLRNTWGTCARTHTHCARPKQQKGQVCWEKRKTNCPEEFSRAHVPLHTQTEK